MTLVTNFSFPLGLALAPWDVFAGDKLRSDADDECRRQTGENGRTLMGPNWERTDNEKKMSKALEKVAEELADGEEPPSVQAGECDEICTTYLLICAICFAQSQSLISCTSIRMSFYRAQSRAIGSKRQST